MSYSNELFHEIERETQIIKHLYNKISEKSMDFRPAEGMRTMRELLHYLMWCAAPNIATFISEENNNKEKVREIYTSYRQKALDRPTEEFAIAMDEQLSEIKKMMLQLKAQQEENNGEERKVKMVWGEVLPIRHAILSSSLKYLVAYRMQLFLYAKMAGLSDLNTINCWMGRDKF